MLRLWMCCTWYSVPAVLTYQSLPGASLLKITLDSTGLGHWNAIASNIMTNSKGLRLAARSSSSARKLRCNNRACKERHAIMERSIVATSDGFICTSQSVLQQRKEALSIQCSTDKRLAASKPGAEESLASALTDDMKANGDSSVGFRAGSHMKRASIESHSQNVHVA